MKIYFLIPTAFSNYLTGSIISGSTMEIFFYEETKFQRLRTNSFCVADFQRELILGDFRWFYNFFTLFRSSSLTKTSTAPTVFKILECGLQCYAHNWIVYKIFEMEYSIFCQTFFKGPEVQKKFNLKIKSRVCDRLL